MLIHAQAAASGPVFQSLQLLKGIANGGQPWAPPISDASGNFYGTTSLGGSGACGDAKWTTGCGAVYKLSPPANGGAWTETLIYQFQNLEDGYDPESTLVFDKAGNLYGTAQLGGNGLYHCGTVFKLSPPSSGSGAWTESTLYSFNCDSNGGHPEAGVVFDKVGNLYGTTVLGGTCTVSGGCGVVFQLSPPSSGAGSWTDTVLYSFQAGTDGNLPGSALVIDGRGNLYGTTAAGGSQNCGYDVGCGTVFELSPPASSGGPWTESILYAFTSQANDGYLPRSAVVFGKSGGLYGVTEGGGANYGGTVFQLMPPASSGGAWTETILFGFGADDGESPFGTPAVTDNGTIVGTTQFGGTNDVGTAFQLAPPTAAGDSWVESTLVNFTNHAYSIAGLTLGRDGYLYGATLGGEGSSAGCATSVQGKGQQKGCGELFRILPR